MPMPRKRPFKNKSQIYAYVWRLNGVVLYVGQGRNSRGRPYCKAGWAGRCAALIEILKKHREEIEWRVFPCSSKAEAVDLERRLIRDLKPKFNRSPHDGGFKGMHTAQGIQNIRAAQIGKKHSKKFRENASLRMLGNQNLLGHIHSEETKQKISQAGIGRKPSNLCRRLASERAKLRNKLDPPRKGKKCSEIHRQRLREAALRRHRKAKV